MYSKLTKYKQASSQQKFIGTIKVIPRALIFKIIVKGLHFWETSTSRHCASGTVLKVGAFKCPWYWAFRYFSENKRPRSSSGYRDWSGCRTTTQGVGATKGVDLVTFPDATLCAASRAWTCAGSCYAEQALLDGAYSTITINTINYIEQKCNRLQYYKAEGFVSLFERAYLGTTGPIWKY